MRAPRTGQLKKRDLAIKRTGDGRASLSTAGTESTMPLSFLNRGLGFMFHGSMVALVTPMHEDGSLDYAALRRLIDFHVEQGTDALVVVGTTGESATLATA